MKVQTQMNPKDGQNNFVWKNKVIFRNVTHSSIYLSSPLATLGTDPKILKCPFKITKTIFLILLSWWRTGGRRWGLLSTGVNKGGKKVFSDDVTEPLKHFDHCILLK